MKAQLYLDKFRKKWLKSQIEDHLKLFLKHLQPSFSDIERKAETYAEEYYNNFLQQPSEEGDMTLLGVAGEKAQEIELYYMEYLYWGKYNLTATWHAMLYQLWEQQVRQFLYQEISHDYDLNAEKFCGNIGEIKKVFIEFGVTLDNLLCWGKVRELSLLCNVIKHAEGESSSKLRGIKPELFITPEDRGFSNDMTTTLLEERLCIDENTLQDYVNSILSFWDELVERSYEQHGDLSTRGIKGINSRRT